MRNKGKQPTNIEGKKEEKCWKCRDKYFTGHKCAFYTRDEIATVQIKDEKLVSNQALEVGNEAIHVMHVNESEKSHETTVSGSSGGNERKVHSVKLRMRPPEVV